MGFFIYTKIMFKCDDDFWERVRRYKRDKDLKTLNAAVRELLDTALLEHEAKAQQVVQN